MPEYGHLIVSRQRDERIRIGDEIIVEVMEIHSGKVRLGIYAPKSIPIHRDEVYEAIIRERLAASKTCKGVSDSDQRTPVVGSDNGGSTPPCACKGTET